MMLEGGIYGYAIPLGRMIAGLFIGTMLAIVGGWLGLTFNAMSGVPWSLEVHRFIYIACIGLGAGVGAYTGWINLGLRWYLIAATVLLVLAAGVAGSLLGNTYGLDLVKETYMGARDTRVNLTHYGAIGFATIVATAQGLYYHFRTRS